MKLNLNQLLALAVTSEILFEQPESLKESIEKLVDDNTVISPELLMLYVKTTGVFDNQKLLEFLMRQVDDLEMIDVTTLSEICLYQNVLKHSPRV